LIIGLLLSLFVVLFAVWWAGRQIGRTAAAGLLAGAWTSLSSLKPKRSFAPWIAIVSLFIAIALLAAGLIKAIPAQAAFMGGGTLLLIAGLSATASLLRPQRKTPSENWSIVSLGLRNAGRHRARSAMTVGLIAFASFVLVTVSAFKATPPTDTHVKD